MKAQSVLPYFSKWILVSCGVSLIALGGYFILARPPLLPEDLRYLGSSAIQVQVLLPRLASWLQSVFTVMGGFMAGCGVLTMFVSMRAIPNRLNGTGMALGAAGLLTVVTMSSANFMLNSDFKWVLVAPSIAWLLGLVTYWASRRAESAAKSTPKMQVNTPRP